MSAIDSGFSTICKKREQKTGKSKRSLKNEEE